MNVATLDTPAGPFTAMTDDDGAVLASGWTADAGDLVPLIHPDLRGDGTVRDRRDLGAATTAARGTLGSLGLTVAVGDGRPVAARLELRVTASTRPLARVLDVTVPDGVEDLWNDSYADLVSLA